MRCISLHVFRATATALQQLHLTTLALPMTALRPTKNVTQSASSNKQEQQDRGE
jgi:hypothetical protein